MASKKIGNQGRRSKEDLNVEYWCEGEGLAKVREWLREKKSDAEIADLIGCNRCSITAWKKKYEMFGTLFQIERKAAVPALMHHAYQHAIGYYKEVEQIDAQGRKQKLMVWYPGNANMQQFLLKNWDSAAYRDKHELELDGKLPVVLTSEDQIPD